MIEVKSFPYDSYQVLDESGNISYDRPYTADDWRNFFKLFVGNGVSGFKSSSMQVRENAPQGMSVIINQGEIFINGNIGILDKDTIINLEASDNQSRIDRVVVKRDLNTDARNMSIYVKKGVPSSSPQAPLLQRDAEIWELALCDILVSSGVNKITNSSITDKRLDNEICGVVHTLFKQVDTSTISQQYDEVLRQFKIKSQQDLDASKASFDTFIQDNEAHINEVLATKKFVVERKIAVDTSLWRASGNIFRAVVNVDGLSKTSHYIVSIANDTPRSLYLDLLGASIAPRDISTPNQLILEADYVVPTFNLNMMEVF